LKGQFEEKIRDASNSDWIMRLVMFLSAKGLRKRLEAAVVLIKEGRGVTLAA